MKMVIRNGIFETNSYLRFYYLGDDGEFTMYIDLVNKKFAKSSTSINRYELLDDIKEMFKKIREGV